MRGQPVEHNEMAVGLSRGAHRWRFVCARRDLPAMLDCLGELAARAETPFDGFDAAVVAHHLSEQTVGASDEGNRPTGDGD